MFGGNSVVSPNDLENVLKILELVGDPAKAKAALGELKAAIRVHGAKHKEAQESLAKAEKRHSEADAKTSSANERLAFLDRREAGQEARAKTVEAEFAKLAAEQDAFASYRKDFEAHADAETRAIASGKASLARREKALQEQADRLAGLEDDVRRRLDLIKSAAA